MGENRQPVGWGAFVDLMDDVLADEGLLPQVVQGVRGMVQEVAQLPVADMAGHTRALLTAAARALAGRRGPSEAELAFVEELAVTRASQGIPIEVVLGAVHVAERAIWTRAREEAARVGLAPEILLDARELYDDWAGEVRARLIRAHRETRTSVGAPRDRQVELLRRLLEGGSAAALAAAEIGVPTHPGLWVLVTRPDGDQGEQRLARAAGDTRGAVAPGVRGQVGDAVVAVLGRTPVPRSSGSAGGADAVVAMAGPVPAEEVGAAYRQALAAVPAAESLGRTGAVHVAEIAGVTALLSRPDLEQVLVARHARAREELAQALPALARTVRVWIEHDRDTTAAAERLYVHANTVRNRVQRFAEVTGVDPHGAFGALDAWWLCRAWDEA